MAKLITDNSSLRQYLPNVVVEVKGEANLYDKIITSLNMAEHWFAKTFLTDMGIQAIIEGKLDETDIPMLSRSIVAYHALMGALPTLDLVLTPNGFGVVSNQNIAPASKDRVAALAASLEVNRDSAIDLLLQTLGSEGFYSKEKKIWCVWLKDCGNDKFSVIKIIKGITDLDLKGSKDLVESAPTLLPIKDTYLACEDLCRQLKEAGASAKVMVEKSDFFSGDTTFWHKDWFSATLFSDLASLGAMLDEHRWESYLKLRPKIISIEAQLADMFFSQELMAALRREALNLSEISEVRRTVIEQIRSIILYWLQVNQPYMPRIIDLVNLFRTRAEDFPEWQETAVSDLFDPPVFTNKKQSSGYFF